MLLQTWLPCRSLACGASLQVGRALVDDLPVGVLGWVSFGRIFGRVSEISLFASALRFVLGVCHNSFRGIRGSRFARWSPRRLAGPNCEDEPPLGTVDATRSGAESSSMINTTCRRVVAGCSVRWPDDRVGVPMWMHSTEDVAAALHICTVWSMWMNASSDGLGGSRFDPKSGTRRVLHHRGLPRYAPTVSLLHERTTRCSSRCVARRLTERCHHSNDYHPRRSRRG